MAPGDGDPPIERAVDLDASAPVAPTTARAAPLLDGGAPHKAAGAHLPATADAGAPAEPAAAPSAAPRQVEKGAAAAADKDKATAEVLKLADQLAYRVADASSPPTSAAMPASPRAMAPFRKGFSAWRRFVSTNDDDALAEAIAGFRAATLEDARFTLAHYRLGLALRADHQPAAAIDAFRASLTSSPEFTAGVSELASTLHDYAYYEGARSAVLSPSPEGPLSKTARDHEARKLWEQIVRSGGRAPSTELAAAYYGLCQLVDEEPSSEDTASKKAGTAPRRLLRGYFYCHRAWQIYAHLPAALRASPEIKFAEAKAIDALGALLATTAGEWIVLAPLDWHCSAAGIATVDPRGQVTERWGVSGPYARVALAYFRRALAVLPDNPVVRCNLAATSVAVRDLEPMAALAADSNAQASLGQQLREKARGLSDPRVAVAYYRMAIEAYEAAITLAPNDVAALNGYAYTFWQWRLAMDASQDSPGRDVATLAEAYARRAARLAEGKRPRYEEMSVRSTLGEVLLGRGRPREAVEVLEGLGPLPANARYAEMRWDLAQAYLCAAEDDVTARAGDIALASKKAAARFDENPQGRARARGATVHRGALGARIRRGPYPHAPAHDVAGRAHRRPPSTRAAARRSGPHRAAARRAAAPGRAAARRGVDDHVAAAERGHRRREGEEPKASKKVAPLVQVDTLRSQASKRRATRWARRGGPGPRRRASPGRHAASRGGDGGCLPLRGECGRRARRARARAPTSGRTIRRGARGADRGASGARLSLARGPGCGARPPAECAEDDALALRPGGLGWANTRSSRREEPRLPRRAAHAWSHAGAAWPRCAGAPPRRFRCPSSGTLHARHPSSTHAEEAMMLGKLIPVGAVAAAALFLSSHTGCYGLGVCPSGQVECGDGCMPAGAVCCDSAGAYCAEGQVCTLDNMCVGGITSNPCAGCLSMGQECCQNSDGVVDCAPLGAACCGDHRYCPSGYVCGGSCGSECCP